MKKWYQIILSVIVALLLATGLALGAFSHPLAAHAATYDDSSYCPFNATPPCQQWWDTATITVGDGYNWGCVDLSSNPWGHYTLYYFDYGWSYTDANGVNYQQSYIAGSGGAMGPYTLVGSFEYFVCG